MKVASEREFHVCTCCRDCQQEIVSLRGRFASLLQDYTRLRDKQNLSGRREAMLGEQNNRLRRDIMEKEMELERVSQQGRVTHENGGENRENSDEVRKLWQKVGQLNHVINAKNRDIMVMRNQLERSRSQMEGDRSMMSQQSSVHMPPQQHQSMHIPKQDEVGSQVAGRERWNGTFSHKQRPKRPQNDHKSQSHLTVPTPQSHLPTRQAPTRKENKTQEQLDNQQQQRLLLIASRIKQLQQQNSQLRSQLTTNP